MQVDSETQNGELEASETQKRSEPSSSAEQVGFGRPPQATRFKKGTSGNPKGRPKGCLNVTAAFTKALREKVVINEGGKRKTVTKLEAALKQLVNKAASGEIRALKQLVELANDAETKQRASSASQGPNLNDLDQDVMQGILKRFESSVDNSTEASNDPQPA